MAIASTLWLIEQLEERGIDVPKELEKQAFEKELEFLGLMNKIITDEEITKSARRYNITDFGQMSAYVVGAKWVIENLKK